MTKRDLFRIIIKLFALYSLVLTVFSLIPSNFVYVIYDFEILPILAAFVFAFIAFLIYYVLIKKTDQIIDFLRIDNGFDDQNIVLGNMDSNKILMLGIILIGGFLLIENLADFIQYSYLAFKKEVSKANSPLIFVNDFGSSTDYFNWVFSGINIVLGYLLLTNYNRISTWISRKNISDA